MKKPLLIAAFILVLVLATVAIVHFGSPAASAHAGPSPSGMMVPF